MAQLLVLTATLAGMAIQLKQPKTLRNNRQTTLKFFTKQIPKPYPITRWFGNTVNLLAFAVVLTLLPSRYAHYKALGQWHEANQFYQLNAFDAASEQYANAMAQLSHDGLFLQMYAKCLQMQGFNKESLELLRIAQLTNSGTIIQLTLGDCYAALEQNQEAANAYQKAWNMIPSRLFPGYKLAMHYQHIGEHALAVATAQEVLNLPIKVKSTAVDEIHKAMQLLVNTPEYIPIE
ncbi:MAG: hypothetical protein QM786_02800 [Breznakibacter sp.]